MGPCRRWPIPFMIYVTALVMMSTATAASPDPIDQALSGLERDLGLDPYGPIPHDVMIGADLGVVLAHLQAAHLFGLSRDDLVPGRTTPGASCLCPGTSPSAPLYDMIGATIRYLICDTNSVRDWRCAAVLLSLLPSMATADTDHGSLLAALFQRTLRVPDHAIAVRLSGLYLRILIHAVPYPPTDALHVFHDQIVSMTASAGDPIPEALHDLDLIWEELLSRSSLDDVLSLARRQSGVLEPRTWAWTYFGLVRRLFRQRRTPWRRPWTNRVLSQWTRCVRDAVQDDRDADAFVTATVVRGVLGPGPVPSLTETVLAVLVQGELRSYQIASHSELDRSLSSAFRSEFNNALAQGRLGPAEILYGLDRGQLPSLVRALVQYSPRAQPDRSQSYERYLLQLGEFHSLLMQQQEGASEAYAKSSGTPAQFRCLAKALSFWLTGEIYSPRGHSSSAYPALESLLDVARTPNPRYSTSFRQMLLQVVAQSADSPALIVAVAAHPLFADTVAACAALVRTVQEPPSASFALDQLHQRLLTVAESAAPFVRDAVPPLLAHLMLSVYWSMDTDRRRFAPIPSALSCGQWSWCGTTKE